ncbi:MAG: SRPBCC family protein [Gammaproteobacteria bacterium]
MHEFSLTTRWMIPAPVEKVWHCLASIENWPSWWRYVERVEEIRAGDLTGINAISRYVWRTSLPYRLTIDMHFTRVVNHRSVEVVVTGDLVGRGRCSLHYRADEGMTELNFIWNVIPEKFWMKLLSAVAYPLLEWNHARVMKSGERGLIRQLVTW